LPNPFKRAAVPLSVDELLDISFRRAFKKPRPIPRRGDKVALYRSKEVSRIQTITDTVVSRLDKVVKSFPSVERLDPFYRELLDVLADANRVKHSLGAIKWASKTISRISKVYISKIKWTDNPERMAALRREATGRISSILKRIRPEVDFLREVVPRLRSLPDLDPSLPSVVIAGMPNTGKSTLLSRITTKEPEIAPYPFTTKGIIIGHQSLEGVGKVQFIDTPGLLDRPLSKRNKIEMQAVVALRHVSGLVLYLMDPTETCGYTLEEQISLLRDIVANFSEEIIVLINKKDLEGEYPDKFSKIRAHLLKEGVEFLEISAEEGLGIGTLLETIKSKLGRKYVEDSISSVG